MPPNVLYPQRSYVPKSPMLSNVLRAQRSFFLNGLVFLLALHFQALRAKILWGFGPQQFKFKEVPLSHRYNIPSSGLLTFVMFSGTVLEPRVHNIPHGCKFPAHLPFVGRANMDPACHPAVHP